MNTFLNDIWVGLTTASPLDQANLVLGVVGVWLMVRRKLAAFPVGLVAVSVQGVLFWQAQFYADALLQVFFFTLLAYGWWHWTHPGRQRAELPVTTQSWTWRLLTLGLAIVAWVAWGRISDTVTDAPMPYRDAFIAAFSVAGQALQARKKLENWTAWVAVNLVAIWSYWLAGLHYTAFLFGIYLFLGISGWFAWAKAMRSTPSTPSAPPAPSTRPAAEAAHD